MTRKRERISEEMLDALLVGEDPREAFRSGEFSNVAGGPVLDVV